MAENRHKRARDYFVFYQLGFCAALLLWWEIKKLMGEYLALLVVALLLLGCIAFGAFLKRLRDQAYGHKDGVDVVYRKKNTSPEQRHNEHWE